MARNDEGRLAAGERRRLEALVAEAEEITLANARYLARQRKRLRKA
jgi:hypothetical protein